MWCVLERKIMRKTKKERKRRRERKRNIARGKWERHKRDRMYTWESVEREIDTREKKWEWETERKRRNKLWDCVWERELERESENGELMNSVQKIPVAKYKRLKLRQPWRETKHWTSTSTDRPPTTNKMVKVIGQESSRGFSCNLHTRRVRKSTLNLALTTGTRRRVRKAISGACAIFRRHFAWLLLKKLAPVATFALEEATVCSSAKPSVVVAWAL